MTGYLETPGGSAEYRTSRVAVPRVAKRYEAVPRQKGTSFVIMKEKWEKLLQRNVINFIH